MSVEVLRNVRIVNPVTEEDRQVDVLIAGHTIGAIAPHLTDIPEDAILHDCEGMVLGPGLVDLYSQSGEPGNESRETLSSLQHAGIAGGFTRLTLLPTTDPPLDHPNGVQWVRHQALSAPPSVAIWGACTQAADGQQMAELADLAAADVVGFADGRPIANLMLIRRILEYAKPLQRPVALWCCDRTLHGSGQMRDGIDAMRFGLPGIPAIAETAALSSLLECIAAVQTPVHLMRISTARSVELIAQAKERGVPITASTTWMHLLHNTTALKHYNPHLKLDPPLGTPADQHALQWAVQAGIIDAIAIDHTPYTYEEKTVAFAEAPSGAIGLELALPLLWQAFVASGQWPALTLWRALSTRPAQCLQQPPASLHPQQQAEAVLFDPHSRWDVTPGTLQSRAYNTPWLGQTITGQVKRTWPTQGLSA